MSKNLSALILLVIAGGIYFTVTSGMIAEDKAIKAVDDQYATALSSAAQLTAARDRVVDQYNAISADDRDKLDKLIPSSVDTIRLIIDINNIALQKGFSLPDIKATAAAGPAPVTGTVARTTAATGGTIQLNAASFAAPVLDTVTVAFSATADYNQFISFLQELEANLRVMDVTHLTMSAKDNGLYTFQVQLQTYWLRQ